MGEPTPDAQAAVFERLVGEATAAALPCQQPVAHAPPHGGVSQPQGSLGDGLAVAQHGGGQQQTAAGTAAQWLSAQEEEERFWAGLPPGWDAGLP